VATLRRDVSFWLTGSSRPINVEGGVGELPHVLRTLADAYDLIRRLQILAWAAFFGGALVGSVIGWWLR
jgi:hypothetical protein